jgi:hypothetical protein
VIISISTIEHDGLGRYGDPLDPNADLASMAAIRSLLKPRGLFFLSVPVGADLLVWNLHRRYGELRLPLLLAGWEVYGRIGWIEEMLTKPGPAHKTYEPVFVLQPQPPAGDTAEL